jgi:hypothetical protein
VCVGVVSEIVAFGNRDVRIDCGVDLGAQGVPDPPDAKFPYIPDPGNTCHGINLLHCTGR